MTERKLPKGFVALLLKQRLEDAVEGFKLFKTVESKEGLLHKIDDIVLILDNFISQELDSIIVKDYLDKKKVAEK